MSSPSRSKPEIVQSTLLELVRAPRNDLAEAVEKYLRTAAEGLGVERAGLWLYSPERESIVETYRYELGSRAFSTPGVVIKARDYPRYFAALEEGGMIAAADACVDPRTSEFADEYLRPQRIPSLLDVPIWRAGALAGILCLEPVGAPRAWAAEEQLFAGGIGAMITLAIEVDARRTAEHEALARERELRDILNQMVDVVTIVDRQGALRFVNKAGMRMIGADEDGPVPTRERMRDAGRLHTADGRVVAPSETPLARALVGATVHDAQLYATRPLTGERMVIRTSAAPFYDEAGQIAGAVAVTRDVTAIEELDEIKDQFLRVAAHELRTPVGIIKGYAQLMQRRFDEGKPVTPDLVKAILQGADRLTRLVQDLLEALRYQGDVRSLPFESGRVDLRAVAAEALRDVEVAAKEHKFVFVAGPGDAEIEGDANRLRQAFIILLDNASKYAPAGTTVTLSVSGLPGKVRAEVADEGIGVPPEKRDRLFEIFFRAHTDTPNDFGGLGVGLYLARQIVQRHGGEIGHAPRDRGSVFWFEIPARGEGKR